MVGAYWVHLGGFKIAAEIFQDKARYYTQSSKDTRDKIVDQFRKFGVKAVIQEGSSSYSPVDVGWIEIGDTDYYVYFFDDKVNQKD